MGRNIYKCAYPKCKYGGEVNKDEAVKVSNRYYHKECLAEKNAKLEIIDVWVAKVDPHPIFNLLRKTIDILVDKEGNDAEYLLFALKYCLNNGWNISYPAALKYVVKDISAKKEWEKIQGIQTQKKMQKEITIQGEDDYSATPIINTNKPKGFGSILGR